MNRTKFKFYVSELFKARITIFAFVILTLIPAGLIFHSIKFEKVKETCIITKTGWNVGQYESSPYAICALENGKLILVGPSDIVSPQVADTLALKKIGEVLNVFVNKRKVDHLDQPVDQSDFLGPP